MGTSTEDTATPAWWREREFLLLVVLVSAALVLRLGSLPLHGEEPRWSLIGAEMAATGDWIVPRQQGEVLRSRPPLHCWLIAASEAVFASREPWVVRVPSVLAVFLTVCLIYGYSRQFLGRIGAFAAALVYPSVGEILMQSKEAETEPVFILFVSASLLLWHWGYSQGWRPWRVWTLAYVSAALACLCKGGLQPPVYLVGTTGLYLVWKRDWRFLFGFGHLVGLVAGVAVAAAWAVPCANRVGWELTKQIWFSDTTGRFMAWRLGRLLEHLAVFPTEVFGCLMPWSLLLLGYVLPANRRLLVQSPCVGFCALAAGLAFLSCWIPPEGRTRYYCPLYPCLAILIGVVVGKVSEAASDRLRSGWRVFLAADAIGLASFALVVLVSLAVLPGTRLDQLLLAPGRAFAFALALLTAAAVVWRARGHVSPRGVQTALLGVAAGTALICTGVIMDIRVHRANDVAASVAPVRERIGSQSPLVSFGQVTAVVPYYLGRVVPVREMTPTAVEPGDYFCFMSTNGERLWVPFAWQEVAAVSVDRTRNAIEHNRTVPFQSVVVGQRLPAPPQPAEGHASATRRE